MTKNLIIFITFIGLFGFLSSCKKDETKIVKSDNPIAPTIHTLPDLTLSRDNGLDTLVFICTPVNPGFNASATYFLEADTAGNNFDEPVVIYNGVQDSLIKISVGNLNGILLKRFPANKVSNIDIRIRSVLVVDAGTGAPGTSTNPFVYISNTENAAITIYGLPRLDLIGSGIDQIIESPLGNGKYSGYVKLDVTKPFTLKDPDANIIYGNNGGALAVNGTDIPAGGSGNGWYELIVNTNDLTYSINTYMIGLVGSATPNDWNSPDSKMDYILKQDCWYIKIDLTDEQFKFRLNDVWAWNMGGKGTSDGSADNYTDDNTVPLSQGGKNIGLLKGAGNYTIKLYIKELKAVITKN